MQENIVLRKDFRTIGSFSAVAGVFSAVATLGYGLVVGQMVDAAANSTYERVPLWAGVTIAFYVVQELLGVAYNFAISWMVPDYEHKTRGLLLVHWLKIVPKRRMTAGKMNTAFFNDLPTIVRGTQNCFFYGGYGLACIAGSLSIMFWLHWIIGLTAVGVALIDTAASLAAGKFADKIEQKISKSTESFYGKARETDDNKIQYVSMRLLGRFKKVIERVYKLYAKEQLELQVKSGFAYNFSTMVAICAAFAPIIAGGLLFGQQQITYGAIAILVILSREVSAVGLYIENAVTGYLKTQGLKKKYVAKKKLPVHSISYSDFTPHFSKEAKANYALNLEVSKGRKYLLKGPNGIGKSTALEILSRQIEYDGKLKINEKEVKNQSELDEYYTITPVASNALFENITQINECSEDDPNAVFLQTAELVAPVLEKKGKTKEASQGEKQILSLLHVLANKPAVLMIDETLSSVEEKIRKQIYGLLLEQSEMAIVVVDHTMDAATEGRFDEVINLK